MSRIDQSIIDELRAMADIVEDSAETESLEDSNRLDAGYLRAAADKFERGDLNLSANERQVVQDELENWTSKDAWVAGRDKSILLTAQAALGFLDVFDENACYFPRRPKTKVIDGVRYIIG